MWAGLIGLFLLVLSGTAGAVVITPAMAACASTGEGTFKTALKIWKTSIATIHNIFPIKVGGITVATFKGLEDIDFTNSPVCVCTDPFPRIGIRVSLWEPIALIEVTKIPSCFPTFGASIPLPGKYAQFAFGGQDSGGDDAANHHSYQFHYIKFPIFAVLGMFLDFLCLDSDDLDLGFISEVDPLWQSDVWSAVFSPEAILVANPIAQFACMADAAASNLGFPLDFLWWCMGSWGSLYPYAKSSSQVTNLSSSMAISTRAVAKMHRMFVLKGSVGSDALCNLYPMPVMRKSQYSLLPIHPVPSWNRIPIGRSETLWGSGKEVPFVNHHVYVNVLYRKRDCCAF
jgi:conjugal transfer pilus assembly protein TraU